MAASTPLEETAAGAPSWKVVICEDHSITRSGLASTLAEMGYRVMGATALGEEAIDLVEQYKPDLLLLDQKLPGQMNGRKVQQIIRQRGWPTKVFVLTSYCDSASFFDWITSPDGPDGVLAKTASLYELRIGVQQVLTTGTRYIPDSILNREHSHPDNPLNTLAGHELRIVRDIALGCPLKEVARRQRLSPNTVRSYMNAIYCKLNLPYNTLQALSALYGQYVAATNHDIPSDGAIPPA